MTDLSPKIMDTTAAIAELVELLTDVPKNPPSIYVDLEGINLSRHGSISIMQISLLPRDEVYLIDVYTLGQEAFSHPSTSGKTLKGILEDKNILKAFFDVRNDSDALYAAGNGKSGKEIMTLLLDRRGDQIKITENVVLATAWNERSGKEIILI